MRSENESRVIRMSRQEDRGVHEGAGLLQKKAGDLGSIYCVRYEADSHMMWEPLFCFLALFSTMRRDQNNSMKRYSNNSVVNWRTLSYHKTDIGFFIVSLKNS